MKRKLIIGNSIAIALLLPSLSRGQIGGSFLPMASGPELTISAPVHPRRNTDDVKYSYFKGAQIYMMKQGSDKKIGLTSTTDAVLFGEENIIVLSYSAKVYKILSSFVAKTTDNSPGVVYTVVDKDGHPSNIIFLKKSFGKGMTTRVVIDDHKNPISFIDGNTGSVF